MVVGFASEYLLSSILSRLQILRAAVLLVLAVPAILLVDVQLSHLGWNYFAERRDWRRNMVLESGCYYK